MSKEPVVEIQGKQLKLSNLDKVLYPATGFTKGQVIDYYARIAPILVTHLAGRPLTLKRYPNGVDSEFFFEKNATAPSAGLGKDRTHLERTQPAQRQLHSGQ